MTETSSKTTYSISWTRNWAWLPKNCKFWKHKDKKETLIFHRQDKRWLLQEELSKSIKLLRIKMNFRLQATTNSHLLDLNRLRTLRHLNMQNRICNFDTRSSLSLLREPSIKRISSNRVSPGIRREIIFIAPLHRKWVSTNKSSSTNMKIRIQVRQIWPQIKRIRRRGICRWKLTSTSKKNQLIRIKYFKKKFLSHLEMLHSRTRSILTISAHIEGE